VCHFTFAPDWKKLASNGCGGDDILLWKVTDTSEAELFGTHWEMVRHVAFSPDGRLLASSSNKGTVKLWDVKKGEERLTLDAHRAEANWIDFSPDSAELISGGDDAAVHFWDTETGERLRTLDTMGFRASDMAFGPDGIILALVDFYKKNLQLFDVETGDRLATWPAHSLSIDSVDISPDGKFLASAASDGVKIWDLDPDTLLRDSCRRLQVYLENTDNLAQETLEICNDIL
jgi:WD40 repeat protein